MAGWGSRHDFACTTGEKGPSPYTQCKFPFYYIGIPFFKCSHIPSPSSKDALCKALIEKEEFKKFPPTGFTQVGYAWVPLLNSNIVHICPNRLRFSVTKRKLQVIGKRLLRAASAPIPASTGGVGFVTARPAEVSMGTAARTPSRLRPRV